MKINQSSMAIAGSGVKIKFSISLWNFFHYANLPSLERIIKMIRNQGYGIELWSYWQDETDLYDSIGCSRLKPCMKGMCISLHTACAAKTFDLHKKQIDAAAELGAKVVVLHSRDLRGRNNAKLDVQLVEEAIDYAEKKNVRLALENGELHFLERAIDKVKGLGICLDVGHVYFSKYPMRSYLKELKHRLIHLHIQDILPPNEKNAQFRGDDHFIPGTGGIPMEDWLLIAKTIKEIRFQGIAVFEIQPRTPFQTAMLAQNFMGRLLEV